MSKRLNMSNDEAVEWLLSLKNLDICGENRKTAIDKAIQALDRKWIPVSKKLPKADEYIGNVAKYYLVQNKYGDMLVARYTHREYDHWEQIYQLQPINDEIVAWMPLPEPYKEDAE